MSYFFNTAFLTKLRNGTAFAASGVVVYLFEQAPTFDAEEPPTEGMLAPSYASINFPSQLETQLGWGHAIRGPVATTTQGNFPAPNATLKYIATVAPTEVFDLVASFPSTMIRALVFCENVSGPTTDQIMFATNTPLFGGMVLNHWDSIMPQLNTGLTPNRPVLFTWTPVVSPTPQLAKEGDIRILKGTPPFDSARTQHVWVYPQRVNYICNPSFETIITEVQTITFGGTITGGTFRITLLGVQTGAINWNGTAEEIKAVIDTAIPVNTVIVDGGPVNSAVPIKLTYPGYTDPAQVTVASSLTGTSVTVTPSTVTPQYWRVNTGSTLQQTAPAPPGAGVWAGRVTGTAPLILESNFFPLVGRRNEPGFTIQLKARCDTAQAGRLKVALLTWEDDFTNTNTDWGVAGEEWSISGGFAHIRTMRSTGETAMGQLRIEVIGCTYFDIDQVCVEPGLLPTNGVDWPYFDGDSLYDNDGDYSWYGGPSWANASYSCWYNFRYPTFGRLFAEVVDTSAPGPGAVFTEEDEARQGSVFQWVPAGTQVEAHLDVLYVGDPRTQPLALNNVTNVHAYKDPINPNSTPLGVVAPTWAPG